MAGSGNNTPFFVAGILLLLLLSGILLYNNLSMRNQHTEALEVLGQQQADLENEYDRVMEELEMYKQENVELDSTLVQIQEDVEAKQAEIERLLRSGRASRGELQQARDLIASMRYDVDNYKQQIAELQYKNQQLDRDNQTLTAEKELLTTSNVKLQEEVTEKAAAIVDLEDTKRTLESERSELSEEKDMLTAKVTRGQVLQASAVRADGVKYKKNGKEIEVKKARQTEKIRVCFDVMPNPLAQSGGKDVMMRLTTGKGEPVYLPAQGSGTFENADTGEEMRFTTAGTIDYRGQQDTYCMYWQQDTYPQGEYTAEVWQDGYMMGSTKVDLK